MPINQVSELGGRGAAEVADIVDNLQSAASMEELLAHGRRLRAAGAWIAAVASHRVLSERYGAVIKVCRVSSDIHVLQVEDGFELVWPVNPRQEDLVRRNRVVLGMRPTDHPRSALPALLLAIGVSPTPTTGDEVEQAIREVTDLLEDLALPTGGEVELRSSEARTGASKGGVSPGEPAAD